MKDENGFDKEFWEAMQRLVDSGELDGYDCVYGRYKAAIGDFTIQDVLAIPKKKGGVEWYFGIDFYDGSYTLRKARETRKHTEEYLGKWKFRTVAEMVAKFESLRGGEAAAPTRYEQLRLF